MVFVQKMVFTPNTAMVNDHIQMVIYISLLKYYSTIMVHAKEKSNTSSFSAVRLKENWCRIYFETVFTLKSLVNIDNYEEMYTTLNQL